MLLCPDCGSDEVLTREEEGDAKALVQCASCETSFWVGVEHGFVEFADDDGDDDG